MKRISAILLVAICHAALAENTRIAQFDAEKVFACYERSKELTREMQSHKPSDDPKIHELFERYKVLMNELSHPDIPARAGTREREAYDLKEKVTKLEMRELEGEINRRKDELQKALETKSKVAKDEIYRDIWSTCKSIAKEDGYVLVVPQNIPDDRLPRVIVSDGDDITERLILQLNKKYVDQKAK